MAKKHNAMGRGLGTILTDANMISTMTNHKAADDDNSSLVTAGIANIALDEIDTNPYQPRKEFQFYT